MARFSKKQPDLPRRRQDGGGVMSERATESSLEQRYAFRRNRTLTGSASSQVVSVANESNAQLKSARVHAHDLVQQRRRITGVLSLVLLGVAVLFGLVYQLTAQVAVRTSDVTQTLEPDYANAIEDYLAQQPIERLRFLLRESALTSYLRTITPEVSAVHVEGYAGLGKSSFVVKLRQPIAGWSMHGTQQYVDASGVSFVRNHFATPEVQIIDNSGIQVEAGQTVASNQFLSFVGRVIGLANASQQTVTQVVIPQGTTRQIELHLKNTSYPVKLSIDRPAGEQIEDMVRSLTWLKTHGVSPQYLDVRVSGRAFYL